MKRLFTLLPGAILAIACEDPLKHAERLEEPRILGVRVISESGEASLTPGAGASVELLAAGPEGPVDGLLAYEVCVAVASDRGVPSCAHEPFAEGVAPLSETIALTVPEDVPAGVRLAFLGAACTSGDPALGDAPLDWSCSDDEEPLRVSFDATTRTPTFTHQNPDLSELRLEVGGSEVPLDDPRLPPSCAAGSAVRARAAHGVAWHVGERARETAGGAEVGTPEPLQLSHFSTAGHFERSLSFVGGGSEPTGRLVWNAPAAGVAAKLYLVVRDGRGGVSWVSATVCAR
jgi:hypothetical protein